MSRRRGPQGSPPDDLPLWESDLPVLLESQGEDDATPAVHLYSEFEQQDDGTEVSADGYLLQDLTADASADETADLYDLGPEQPDDEDQMLPLEDADPVRPSAAQRPRQAEPSLEAQRLREQMLADASEEAARIIALAQEQAVLIAQSAHRDAVAAVASEQVGAFRSVMRAIHADISEQFQARWSELEMEAAKLCVEFAENVIYRKIADDDTVVLDTVREGLKKMIDVKGIAVHVSPAAVQVLENARETLAREIPNAISIQLTPDESVSPGGAVLRGAAGEVDLQIEKQVARLKQAAETAIAAESRREVPQ
jgi:flagellar biosynthesis/type III secretory pathway protein FliH